MNRIESEIIFVGRMQKQKCSGSSWLEKSIPIVSGKHFHMIDEWNDSYLARSCLSVTPFCCCCSFVVFFWFLFKLQAKLRTCLGLRVRNRRRLAKCRSFSCHRSPKGILYSQLSHSVHTIEKLVLTFDDIIQELGIRNNFFAFLKLYFKSLRLLFFFLNIP